MFSLRALVWSLLQAVFVATFDVAEQRVLTLQDPGLVLRRFIAGPSDGIWNVHAIHAAAQASGLDIWQVGPSYLDVRLPAANESLDALTRFAGLQYSDSIIPSSLVRPQTLSGAQANWNLSSLSNTTFHSTYHSIEDIGVFVKELLDLYPDNVELVRIGHSSENREMFVLEISKDKGLRGRPLSMKKKTGFIISGAQHAREWIATSTAMFLAHALLAAPSESYSLAPLLSSYDFYFILLPNPDGYVFTWEQDRFWYKNRQIVGPNEKCIGIDTNRNWGHKWKPTARFPAFRDNLTLGVGTDPCSHWYPGHRAFEAPEVNNIANYITTLPNLQAFVDLRSYGQMISAPFSYSCKKTPKDAEDQIEAALGATRSIKATHGTTFTTGTLCSMLYKAPGNIVDYMYAKAGIKFSYAVHLRDTGTYGFLLPPEWIRPVGEETANMIKSIATFIANRKF